MALAHLFFNKPKGFKATDDVTDEIILEVDVTIREHLKMSGTLTKNETETGAQVSDHMAHDPDKLTLDCVVSNTPASILKQLASLNNSKPSDSARQFLQDCKNEALLVDFVGGLQVHTGMVITELDFDRDRSTGQVLHFTATLEKLRFVESAVIEKEKIAPDTQAKAAPSKDLGTQTPVDASGTFQGVEPTAATQNDRIATGQLGSNGPDFFDRAWAFCTTGVIK